MNNKFNELIKEALPEFDVAVYAGRIFYARKPGGGVEIGIHDIPSFEDGCRILTQCGYPISKRQTHHKDYLWSVVGGEKNGVEIILFCAGLPQSCTLETVTERIPKTQTVDTGEFIEVQRLKVKCDYAA